MQTRKTFSTLTFAPPPPIWQLGPDPQWVLFFFQNPNIFVFKMIYATRVSFWGVYVCVPVTPHGAQQV